MQKKVKVANQKKKKSSQLDSNSIIVSNIKYARVLNISFNFSSTRIVEAETW